MPRIRRRFLLDPAEIGVYHRIIDELPSHNDE